MKLPHGVFSEQANTPITLALWAEELRKKGNNVIVACVGEPTFPTPRSVAQSALRFWQEVADKIETSQHLASSVHSEQVMDDVLVETEASITYADDPSGDAQPKSVLADYFTKCYQLNAHPILKDHVLFTVGATAGLNAVFEMINTDDPGCRIITPSPYYWIYKGRHGENNLHVIDVMQEPGYRLNATAIQKSIQTAKQLAQQDGKKIGAFLFCDPNNPLGTVVGKEEWISIAEVLEHESPDIPIILDESYDDLQCSGKYISLLEVAPNLRERMIILHSGTKVLSAAGERLACMLVFRDDWLTTIKVSLTNLYIHAPRSMQHIYAHGLASRSDEEKIECQGFYRRKVKYVAQKLRELKIAMPDPAYQVKGTFYIVANLHELLGLPLPEAAQVILDEKTVTTDWGVAFYLLFQEGLALAPMSCFGTSPQLGYLRITCCDTYNNMQLIIKKLSQQLMMVRQPESPGLCCNNSQPQ